MGWIIKQHHAERDEHFTLDVPENYRYVSLSYHRALNYDELHHLSFGYFERESNLVGEIAMLRRSAWLVVVCVMWGSSIQAQEADPVPAAEPAVEKPAVQGHIAEAEQEMLALMDNVLAATDTNKDGELDQEESRVAREHVAVAMRQNLPKAGLIAGGQVMLDRMERVILQSAIDFNQDRVVDKVELQKFIVMSMGIRDRTLKSPIAAQFQISEEEIAPRDFARQNRLAMEQQKLANYRWMAMAKQQRQQVWFETEMIKRIMRAEQIRDYEKMRDREKNNPDSPGGAVKPAPMPPQAQPAEAQPEAVEPETVTPETVEPANP